MVSPTSVQRPFCRGRSSAFTLIELLTVIAIIGILAAILIPTIGKVRQTAHSAKCVSNLRQIGLATKGWSADNKNRTLIGGRNNQLFPGAADSWSENIVRYLQGNNNLTGANWPENFRCNTWATSGQSNSLTANGSYSGYGMPDPLGGAGSMSRALTFSRSDSTIRSPSQFIYLFESYQWGVWMGRAESQITGTLTQPQDDGLRRHGEKSNYLFLDGSVRPMDLPQVVTAWNTTINLMDGM